MLKDYKLKYKDVYIYGVVTQYFLGKDLINNVDTPYKEDGEPVKIIIRGNSVRGYGRRNWQREALERNRGEVIALSKGMMTALIGTHDKASNMIELYITDTLSSVQSEIANDILANLLFNDIKVTVSTDERMRNKLEKRWHEGDRIQREAGRNERGYDDESDYSDDEPE